MDQLSLQYTWTNVFRVTGAFSRVSFRIYTSLTKECLLYEPELYLRRQYQERPDSESSSNVYVHATDNELYVFWLGDYPPSPPDDSWGLTEISTGLFLASTIPTANAAHASGHTGATSGGGTGVGVGVGVGVGAGVGVVGGMSGSSPLIIGSGSGTMTSSGNTGAVTVPPQYAALVAALKKHLFNRLVRLPSLQLFGDRLITRNGSKILSVDTSITHNGDLVLIIYYDQSNICPASSQLLIPGQSLLYLTPSGSRVTFSRFIECPTEASIFYDILATKYPDSAIVPSLESTNPQWMLVVLGDGRTLAWPQELCFVGVERDDDSEGYQLEDSAYTNRKDIQEASLDHLVKLEVSGITEALSISTNQNASRRRVGESVIGATTTTSTATAATSRRMSLVYPTPPDPKGRINNATSTTNGDAMASATGAETWELDEFEENEEVTEADFNFFDEPDEVDELVPKEEEEELHDEKAEHEHDMDVDSEEVQPASATAHSPQEDKSELKMPLKRRHSSDSSAMESPASSISNSETRSPPPDISSLNKGSMVDTATETTASTSHEQNQALFSAIPFNPLIDRGVDSKYSKGGRFFASSVDQEASGDESDHFKQQEATAGHETNVVMPHSSNKALWQDIILRESGRSSIPIPNMNMTRPKTTLGGNSNTGPSAATAMSVNTNASTVSVADNTSNYNSSNSTCNYDPSALRKILEQVVWDHGMLCQGVPHWFTSKELPDYQTLDCLQQTFPHLASTSIGDFVGNRDNQQQTGHSQGLDTVIASSQPPSSQPPAPYGQFNTAPSMQDMDTSEPASPIPMDTQQAAGAVTGTGSGPGSETAGEKEESKKPRNETFRIESPTFALSRLDHVMKARSPIIKFWKTLGLSPKHGCKDAHVIAIVPPVRGIETATMSFLQLLRSTYSGCELGELYLPPTPVVVATSVDIETNAVIENVGKIVSQSGITSLLVISAFSEQSMFVQTAAAIARLEPILAQKLECRLTWQALDSETMYIIDGPLSALEISPTLLALSIYDKCPSQLYGNNLEEQYNNSGSGAMISATASGTAVGAGGSPHLGLMSQAHPQPHTHNQGTSSRVSSPAAMGTPTPTPNSLNAYYTSASMQNSPAFALARAPPSKISFRARTLVPEHLMDEDSLLHVCYAISPAGDWITAAWCDQWGENSMVDAFCLKPPQSRAKGLEEVFSEIWELTQSYAARRDIRWRVILGKTGQISATELSIWLRLSEHNKGSGLSGATLLYIVNVDPYPSILVGGEDIFPYERVCKSEREQLERDSTTKSAGATPITPKAMQEDSSPDVTAGTPSATANANASLSMTSSGNPNNTNDTTTTATTATTTATTTTTTTTNTGSTPIDTNGQDSFILEDGTEETFGFTIVDDTLNVIGPPDSEHAKPIAIGLIVRNALASDTRTTTFQNPLCEDDSGHGFRPWVKDSQPCRSVYVAIVHSGGPHVNIKALIGQYAKLAALGVYRGVCDPQQACVPWHAHACVKMINSLAST